MIVRREFPSDIDAIRAVTAAAFTRPAVTDLDEVGIEPVEAALVDRLPAFSLVAVDDGEVVGHVVCTRGRVGERAALGLGPLRGAAAGRCP
ncbi:GNAT family N-acetyltransferase [Actinoplanes derwentensis]|uniref:Acetyltransferase n=1 Tax=Actinoplanes derwentensis TaxID=113562 RepID=A0A1H2D723_9ACTN|nr:hypothetical protein [Actinoplanes derwentensis]GID89384.1 hypothetical protein Ade03nite_83080 [Actinoplanes derwentensis]SDT78555.1 hypothetical protein SAMN04489716_8421 [Actinoplanes derwentensis]